jgi:CRP/FNR family transcriptional regulator, anaerobic regulatory protein
MLDSVVSRAAPHSASLEQRAYLARLQAPAALPVAGVLSRPARRPGEVVCQHCPVQKLSLCGALHGAELALMGDLKHTTHFKHKAAIGDQGEPADAVHIVTKGIVRLSKTLSDGRRQIVGFALPGDLLGLAVDDRNAYSAEALGDVSTCHFSRKAFGGLLDAVPHLMRRLHALVAHELSIAQSHMMLLGHYSARQKLAAFLLHTRDRWRSVNGACNHVPLPMPRQDIADYLGLTIETVSRTMSLFARQKLIVIVPDGVRLLDSDRLVEVAGE